MNYSKLRGKIREVLGSEALLAQKLGINAGTLSVKLNGRTGFSQKEIVAVCDILGLDLTEMPDYFFSEVSKC